MSNRPTLLDFIDDELLRAPMTIDQVIDVVQTQWRGRMPGHGRADADPARVLYHHRGELVTQALATLRTSAMADLQAATAEPAASARPAADAGDLMLSLIDEDDVAVDIGIARCTEAVKLKAEIDLRELQTYTSALANDLNVSRDTNPFRPERFVRALWAGVQTLPLSAALKAAFMQAAAEPLATALRRSYAAARQRLEDQGVTPASYRTIVVSGNTHWGASLSRYQPPDDLQRLRSSMPAPLDALTRTATPPPPPLRAAPVASATPPGPAAGGPDPQLIELLARLFESIHTDFKLAPDTVALLQRLQPTALRVALRDPSLLDRYDHALWRFMDQLAHDIELSAPAQRLRLLGLGRNLVDHLSQAEARDSHGFAWALERLLAAQRQALAQAALAAEDDIHKLQRILLAEATPTTRTMPLDIGNLDTVPADLMTQPAPSADAAALGASGLPPGATLRAYLQGEWRTLQSLWQDDHHELTLLREPATDRRWALHQRALVRLLNEGLAHRYKVRSLVRRAAEKVLRAL
ncbi:MAG: hypothetical protein A3E25_20865 [Burkholderiales bacterium RIFCSPHIGHO2_12_FULL_69_20]|nr:MAG: hypothetical protein A3E25_20865 [Burkholderiales bacterium RIFCSPHIGHO2_12_FULL_69_20]